MRGQSGLAQAPAGLVQDGPQGREPERWRAQGASLKRRLESWAEILAETHLSFDVCQTARTPVDFQGAVMRRRIGDLMLVDCAASPFLGSRGQAMIPLSAAGNENILGFQFVCRGVELVRESSREVALAPGDVVLWDGLQPTEVEIVEPFYKRTLIFPRDEVLALCPRLADVKALPALNGNGSARLLVRYMNALALELPQLDTGARIAAASAALELLRATIEPSLPTDRAAGRAALRADVRHYVRTHLQDPALGPVSIAQRYSISVRALHALFEDADASVAALVRGERLARCLEDLRRTNGGSVTEIAFRWGFCDAAHFSRVFKRRYGATPSEIRHAAVAGETSPGG